MYEKIDNKTATKIIHFKTFLQNGVHMYSQNIYYRISWSIVFPDNINTTIINTISCLGSDKNEECTKILLLKFWMHFDCPIVILNQKIPCSFPYRESYNTIWLYSTTQSATYVQSYIIANIYKPHGMTAMMTGASIEIF